MVFQFNDLPSFFQALWAERRSQNRSYSLRAFARDLKLDPGHLSGLLQNKRGLSTPKVYEVAEALHLETRERAYLLALSQLKQARTSAQRKLVEQQLSDLKRNLKDKLLDLDTFAVISDPIHFALLAELESTTTAQGPIQLAQRFGIDRVELQASLNRLLRVGLIEKKNERYIVKRNRTLTQSLKRNEALTHYHQRLHELAAKALEIQSIEERAVGSETLRFNSKQIPLVKQILEDTYAEIVSLAADRRDPEAEIYTFISTFFKRTITKRKTKS